MKNCFNALINFIFFGVFINFIFGVIGGVLAGAGLLALDSFSSWWTGAYLWENLHFFPKMTSITDDQAFKIVCGVWVFYVIVFIALKQTQNFIVLEQTQKTCDWLEKFGNSLAGSLLFVMGFLNSSVAWLLSLDAVFKNASAEAISFNIWMVVSLIVSALGIAAVQSKFS